MSFKQLKYAWLLLAAVLIAVNSGCAGGRVKTDRQDAVNYGRAMKEKVHEFVQTAKKNPQRTSQEAAVLLETLEVHEKRPVGEHKQVYAELTQKCREVREDAQRSPGSAQVNRKLDEINDLANKLPG